LVFSSVEFLFYFLPAFLLIYGLTPARFKNFLLLVGSLLFYALGEPVYLGIMVLSVVVNYAIGRFLGAGKYFLEKSETNLYYANYPDWQKACFALAVMGNIGMLVMFKYLAGAQSLPLGISFYTFQILSYLIDVYRGDIPAEHSFIKVATYIVMFPQLISGPIVNYSEVSASLESRRMTLRSIRNGLKIFTLGLVAKVLLADKIGLLWNDVQVRGFESISVPLAWLGALAYSLKIYFDFYGYSLMAIGLGRMLGFKLPENFKNPYMSRSVREFYRRWHMTLGRWFRNYVYIPLGGNRNGELCTIRNLLIVWILTGLWHGDTPNYLVWSFSLFVLIVVERLGQKVLSGASAEGRPAKLRMHVLPHLYLWLVIPITWMCFAITDLGQLRIYLGRMFGEAAQYPALQGDWLGALKSYGGVLLAGMLCCTPFVLKLYTRFRDSLLLNALIALLFWVCVWQIRVAGDNPFMYFRF